ncbi:transposase [Streptomyces sp. NPDC056227]|uniref:transposase n=1 Tax=Streptomyces sp. NPDC056227 TaxID=3345753 RepID=UPI0035D95518
MGSKSNRSRRYTEEFKRDAVALVRSSGKTVTEVAGRSGSAPRDCGTGSSRTRSTAGRGRRAN